MTIKLTEEQNRKCWCEWNYLKREGIVPGNVDEGGDWCRWPGYYDRWTDNDGRRVKSTDFGTGFKGYVCRKWEAIMYALYKAGQPHTLKDAIRYYYAMQPDDEYREIPAEIAEYARLHPNATTEGILRFTKDYYEKHPDDELERWPAEDMLVDMWREDDVIAQAVVEFVQMNE